MKMQLSNRGTNYLCYHSSEVLRKMSKLCFPLDHQMKLGLRLWSYVREEASHGRVGRVSVRKVVGGSGGRKGEKDVLSSLQRTGN